jgi:alpha-galactosidase
MRHCMYAVFVVWLLSLSNAVATTPGGDELATARKWAVAKFDGVEPLFSFIYGGKASTELIKKWQREVKEEVIDGNRRLRTLMLTDPESRLEVRAIVTHYTDTPGIDWTLYFTNKGSKDTPILERVNALDVLVPLSRSEKPPVLSRLRYPSHNWASFDESIDRGRRVRFAPINGRSSDGASGFFNLSWNGGGVVTAIGWTGQWRAAVENAAEGLHVTAGMQDMRLTLHPGETIRSPRIMQVYWSGDDRWHGYNLFRRAMFAQVMPRINGQLVAPPIAHLSTAFYEMDRATEADVLSHLESIKGLGFEYFWFDAYYGKDDFPTVGNYVFPLLRGFNQKRFPHGIKPIGEAVRRDGMKFLMWFEPERICHGTLMAREHPDWVVLPKDGGWGMFNLGLPDARQYITRYLNDSIKECGIGCLRIDNAVSFRGLWELIDKANPDRRGMAEIRYVEGLYRLWDDLLAANPALFIDNCAAGGGRIDLETCARSIPLWRTDAVIDSLMKKDFNKVAIQNQAITAGLSRYVPFNTGGQMGASPYLFRSGLNGGGISFAEDVRPANYPRDLLKQAIAEAKRLRPYFFGDLYALCDVTVRPEDWCALQYHRPQEQDGMVLAFRRHKSSKANISVKLHEMDQAAEYEMKLSYGYEPSPPRRIKGAELTALNIPIEQLPGSVVIEYCKVKP